MRNVIVPRLKSDSLAHQLVSLYGTFKNASPRESLFFDFSQINWTCPLLMLPIASYINSTKSDFISGDNSNVKSYLSAISFPKGIDSISEFEQQIQKFKSYIPISVLKKEKYEEREKLQGLFESMIYKILEVGEIQGIRNAIFYPVLELAGNIFEHSKTVKGFIFGQYFPKKNYLDICIVDQGRGLASAYLEEKDLKLSDDAALEEVMKGHSTKPDKERGYGVRTSKRVVCEGLGGEFLLLSGSAALISAKSKEKIMSLPNFYWQGVVIAYRIPRPTMPIDISPYLE